MKEYKWIFLPFVFAAILMIGPLNVFIKRVLVIFTFGSILWSIFNLLKQPVLSFKKMILGILIAVISIMIIILSIYKTGW